MHLIRHTLPTIACISDMAPMERELLRRTEHIKEEHVARLTPVHLKLRAQNTRAYFKKNFKFIERKIKRRVKRGARLSKIDANELT